MALTASQYEARKRMRQGLSDAAVAARNRDQGSERFRGTFEGMRDAPHRVLSTGATVDRAVVDRVKNRWLAALKMAQQMDAPPPGQPGGPPHPARPYATTVADASSNEATTPGLARFLADLNRRRGR